MPQLTTEINLQRIMYNPEMLNSNTQFYISRESKTKQVKISTKNEFSNQ